MSLESNVIRTQENSVSAPLWRIWPHLAFLLNTMLLWTAGATSELDISIYAIPSVRHSALKSGLLRSFGLIVLKGFTFDTVNSLFFDLFFLRAETRSRTHCRLPIGPIAIGRYRLSWTIQLYRRYYTSPCSYQLPDNIQMPTCQQSTLVQQQCMVAFQVGFSCMFTPLCAEHRHKWMARYVRQIMVVTWHL